MKSIHKAWYLCGSGDRKQELKDKRGLNQLAESSEIKEEEVTVSKVSWTVLAREDIKYWNIEVEYYKKFNTLNVIANLEGLCNLNNSSEMIFDSQSEFDFRFHCHSEREARYIINGELFYDIINKDKKIIRIHLTKGDFILLPIGMFHRTILPSNCQTKDLKIVVFNDKYENENENETSAKKIETYFLDEIEAKKMELYKNIQQWQEKEKKCQINRKKQLIDKMNKENDCNGVGFVLGGRAKALASYPHARVVNGMIYVSGTSSRRPDNTHIGAIKIDDNNDNTNWDLDIGLQTRAVLENIKIILNHVGAGLQHCVAMTVFLVDFKDYKGMNQVYNQYFDGQTGPTRTTVAVARLPHPNLLIEIQTVAVMPNFSIK